MENIERTQFVVLTGHLDDQPLPDLIRTLRAQRKSGRLQVEYPDAPGAFFFEAGQLVDAQLGTLRGLEAIYAALSLRGASFNFNPLVRPPERSIDRQQQQFISDLVEAPRREEMPEIKAAGRMFPAAAAAPLPPHNAPLQLGPAAAELIAPLEQRLVAVEAAILSTSRRFSRERLVYAGVISFLVGLIIATILQALYITRPASPAPALTAASAIQSAQPAAPLVNAASVEASRGSVPASPTTSVQGGSGRGVSERAAAPVITTQKPETAARQARLPKPAPAVVAAMKETATAAGGNTAARGGYVVHVLMEVRSGQVTGARVLNPRPGAGDYESLALRMARQRRYPENFTGAERLQLRVRP